MTDGVLCYWHVESIKILAELCLGKMVDVCLSTYLVAVWVVCLAIILPESCGTHVIVIQPAWVEVKTEYVGVSALGRVGYCLKNLGEVATTLVDVGIIIVVSPRDAATPASAIEPCTWSVHHTMKGNGTSVRVNKVLAIHLEVRSRSEVWLHTCWE